MSNLPPKNSEYGHWDIDLVGEFDPEEYVGFVYRITRLDTGKAYIGCKSLWKHRKGKRTAASEWRYYASSSNYLKPEIAELGSEAFHFQIVMLCKFKRDLYYNEMKLQVDLGVLESDNYYNANVGGIRFYRPVRSYLNEELRQKLSETKQGTSNPSYRGGFTVTYKNGNICHVTEMTMKEWCASKGFNHRCISNLRRGKQGIHRGIIKVEYDDEREREED